jgi:hypothetical protein
LTAIARELDNVSTGMLEAFAAGADNLGPDKLQALTKILYPHAELDLDSGMLRPVNRTVRTLCTAYPEFIAPPSMGLGNYADGAPQLVTPQPQAPKRRAGWLGGFFSSDA